MFNTLSGGLIILCNMYTQRIILICIISYELRRLRAIKVPTLSRVNLRWRKTGGLGHVAWKIVHVWGIYPKGNLHYRQSVHCPVIYTPFIMYTSISAWLIPQCFSAGIHMFTFINGHMSTKHYICIQRSSRWFCIKPLSPGLLQGSRVHIICSYYTISLYIFSDMGE